MESYDLHPIDVGSPPDSEATRADIVFRQREWNRIDSSDMESFFMRECPHHIEMELEKIGGKTDDQADLMEIIPKVALGLNRDYHRQKLEVAASESGERHLAEASTEEGKLLGSASLGMASQSLLGPPETSATFFNPPEPVVPTSFDRSLDWMSFIDFSGQDLDSINFADFCDPPDNFYGPNVR